MHWLVPSSSHLLHNATLGTAALFGLLPLPVTDWCMEIELITRQNRSISFKFSKLQMNQAKQRWNHYPWFKPPKFKPFKQNPSNMTSYTRIWPHAWVVFSAALSDCCWKSKYAALSSVVPFKWDLCFWFQSNIEEQCQSISISGCIMICPHFMSKLIDMISSNFQHSHTPSCEILHIYTVSCQTSASSFSTLAFSSVTEHDANSKPPENVMKIHLS